MSCVLRLVSCIPRRLCITVSITAKVLKIMNPEFLPIFVMCAVCAQNVMVAPPVILDFLWCQKQFLTF